MRIMSFGTNIKMYNFHVQNFGMMQFYMFISASTTYIYILVWTPCLMHMCVCIWQYITYVPKKYIMQWWPSVAGDMQQLIHRCVCIWQYITYVPKKYITQWWPLVAGNMQQLIGQHKMLSHIFGWTNHKICFKKITKCEHAKKITKHLIFLMFGKNYPNYRKLAKTKKNCPKH